MSSESHSGRVTVNDTPTKSKLYRYCEKKIDQWVKSQSDGTLQLAASDPIEFSVTFTEEENTSQVSCVTEIQLAGAVYRGWDLAGDTQQAFIHSLKRLHLH